MIVVPIYQLQLDLTLRATLKVASPRSYDTTHQESVRTRSHHQAKAGVSQPMNQQVAGCDPDCCEFGLDGNTRQHTLSAACGDAVHSLLR